MAYAPRRDDRGGGGGGGGGGYGNRGGGDDGGGYDGFVKAKGRRKFTMILIHIQFVYGLDKR